MQYSQYEFFTSDEVEQAWLVSLLSDYSFEGFEETTQSLKAYVPSSKVSTQMIEQLLYNNEFSHIGFSVEPIEQKNWNEEWEKNFEPVTIAGKIYIRAPFHQPQNSELEIVIEPKMSFGTGHHATTALVCEMMLDMNFKNKTVLDFGSGTGVLSILAEKLGASQVTAIDNEEWAFENCKENAERNHCSKILAIHSDDAHMFESKFDVILANINRHVILYNLKQWTPLLNPTGELIVSGILQSDEQSVKQEAALHGLGVKKILNRDGWIAISFQHI